MPNHALSLSLHPDSPAPGLPLRIDVELEIDDLLLIEPAVELQLIGAGQLLAQTDSASAGAWSTSAIASSTCKRGSSLSAASRRIN